MHDEVAGGKFDEGIDHPRPCGLQGLGSPLASSEYLVFLDQDQPESGHGETGRQALALNLHGKVLEQQPDALRLDIRLRENTHLVPAAGQGAQLFLEVGDVPEKGSGWFRAEGKPVFRGGVGEAPGADHPPEGFRPLLEIDKLGLGGRYRPFQGGLAVESRVLAGYGVRLAREPLSLHQEDKRALDKVVEEAGRLVEGQGIKKFLALDFPELRESLTQGARVVGSVAP